MEGVEEEREEEGGGLRGEAVQVEAFMARSGRCVDVSCDGEDGEGLTVLVRRSLCEAAAEEGKGGASDGGGEAVLFIRWDDGRRGEERRGEERRGGGKGGQ